MSSDRPSNGRMDSRILGSEAAFVGGGRAELARASATRVPDLTSAGKKCTRVATGGCSYDGQVDTSTGEAL